MTSRLLTNRHIDRPFSTTVHLISTRDILNLYIKYEINTYTERTELGSSGLTVTTLRLMLPIWHPRWNEDL